MAKAISISIQTIVVLALAVMVLMVLAVFFTGSGKTLLGGMSDFVGGTQANMSDLGSQTKDFMLGNYSS